MNLIPKPQAEAVPVLEAGDSVAQPPLHPASHRLHGTAPARGRPGCTDESAHLPPPRHPRHGRSHLQLATWLGVYVNATPGTDAFDNTTMILGTQSEPQPDATLIILPEHGG